MDINNFPWLDLIDYPAFCVKDGAIIAANALALQRQFQVGMTIADIVTEQQDIYESFESGNLHLNVNIYSTPCPAVVTRTPEYDIFRIHRDEDDDILQALSLAATQLNEPLSDLLTLTSQEDFIGKSSKQANRFQKHLYKLLRIVLNMSDAGKYSRTAQAPTETANLVSLVAEIMEKTQTLFAGANIQLAYDGPTAPVFGVVCIERLERAIYNLLSNAAKYAKKGSTVTASLSASKDRLTFTLTNTNATKQPRQNLWQQYRREPDLDPTHGLGLGMTLASAVATSHGGTILVDNPVPDQTRITMTIPIVKANAETLRSPIVRMNDYTGGRDKGLIEFSEVLPADAYKEIN